MDFGHPSKRRPNCLKTLFSYPDSIRVFGQSLKWPILSALSAVAQVHQAKVRRVTLRANCGTINVWKNKQTQIAGPMNYPNGVDFAASRLATFSSVEKPSKAHGHGCVPSAIRHMASVLALAKANDSRSRDKYSERQMVSHAIHYTTSRF